MSKDTYKRRKKTSNRKPKDENVKSDNRKSNEQLNCNDPRWYIRDDVMKVGLTRMPTLEFMGTNVPWDNGYYLDSQLPEDIETREYIKSPTLAVYKMNPSPGRATDGSSPINMAGRMLYSKLSSSNAKTSNYAPQDVTTLMLAIGEIISLINHATRLYGITQYYNKINRAIPTVFLKAHGITNVATWTRTLPDFRADLNQLITIANSISFPDNIPYFKKCAYIYQNVFIDNYSAMTPYHMMVPYSTWRVDETSYEGGTILKTNTNISAANLLTTLRGHIDAILTSSTYNYIYSDILNLATRGVLGANLLSFGTVPIDYVVEPILSDQFNWQIMNATIFGVPNGTNADTNNTPSNDVLPNVNQNALEYRPLWRSSSLHWYRVANVLKPLIRCPDINVSEDDLIELMAYTGFITSWLKPGDPQTHTVEVIAKFQGAYPDDNIPDHYITSVVVYHGDAANSPTTVDRNSIDTTIPIAAFSSEFEHFPLIYGFSSYNEVGDYRKPADLKIYSRLGTYTTRINKALSNLRNATYLGLFTMD